MSGGHPPNSGCASQIQIAYVDRMPPLPNAARAPLTATRDAWLAPELRFRTWETEQTTPQPASEYGHPAIEIALVTRGRALYHVGRRRYAVGAGRAFLVPLHVGHTTILDAGTIARSFWLTPDGVDSDFARESSNLEPGLLATAGPLGRLFDRALDVIDDGSVDAALRAQSLAFNLAELFISRRDDTGLRILLPDPRVNRAIEHIHAHFREPISIAELARTAAMSPFHFSRWFQRCMGQSPYRYVVRVRLETARTLLETGEHSVTDAAFAVGFNDLGRFSMAFRRELGLLPSSVERASRRARIA